MILDRLLSADQMEVATDGNNLPLAQLGQAYAAFISNPSTLVVSPPGYTAVLLGGSTDTLLTDNGQGNVLLAAIWVLTHWLVAAKMMSVWFW